MFNCTLMPFQSKRFALSMPVIPEHSIIGFDSEQPQDFAYQLEDDLERGSLSVVLPELAPVASIANERFDPDYIKVSLSLPRESSRSSILSFIPILGDELVHPVTCDEFLVFAIILFVILAISFMVLAFYQ